MHATRWFMKTFLSCNYIPTKHLVHSVTKKSPSYQLILALGPREKAQSEIEIIALTELADSY